MKPMTIAKTITRIAILALLLPAGFLAAQKPDSAAINDLLSQVKNHAELAEDDADTLESYSFSKLHWSTHAARLSLIKEHVNNLIVDGNKLASMRDEGSPWQQEAIDRITPLLPVMGEHLTATFKHFNDNTTRTQMKPYREYASANQALIHNAHEIISDYVEYGEAKTKVEALEKELQQTAVAGSTS